MIKGEFKYVKTARQIKGVRIVGGKILVLYFLDGEIEKIKCETAEEAQGRYYEILTLMDWN